MKITRKTLEKIIKEELEEAMTMAQLDLSKSDPNEKLLQLMGKVMNRAMEMMGTDESALGTKMESEMSKMSNEIVTLVSKGLDDIDGMAQELVERFREKYQG